MVDWQQKVDYLRCHPIFHGNPRFDHIIVKTASGHIFAQLVFLFNCVVDGTTYPIALIQPFDAPAGPRQSKDKDLCFYRVRRNARISCEFISTRSIVRGALLVEDYERVGDFLVMDLVDTDMFLRMKAIS